MPADLCDGTSYRVWILEYHHSLGGNILRQKFRLFAAEILLIQINLVVLSDSLLGTSSEISRCLGETECWVSVQFLLIFSDISSFGVV